MKRFIALVLVFAMAVSICGSLAGCSAANDLQMGTWLSLIAESFGMDEFTSPEPYFAKVSAEDSYFGAFQLAAEWEILAPDANTSSETEVTWKTALITLVNAGGFLSVDTSDDEKIEFAINNFDPSIRTYWMSRNIKMSEAVPLLDIAAEMWINKTYSEKVEEWQMSEEVTDLIKVEDLEYEKDGDVVTIDASMVEGLSEGDVYTLPGITGVTSSSINRIASIEYDGDTAIITNDTTFDSEDLAEVLQNVQIQETSDVDFSELSTIYDANGNVLYSATDGVNEELAQISYGDDEGVHLSNLVSSTGDDLQATDLGLFKSLKMSFKVDGMEVKLAIGSNSIGVTLAETQWSKDSQLRDESVTFSGGVTLKDIKLTTDIDLSWGKLKSALFRLDYTSELTGGVEYKQTSKVGSNIDGDEYKSIQGLSSLVSKYKSAFSALSKDLYDTKYDDKSVYICRIAIPGANNGITGLDFIVTGQISVSGQLQIKLTVNGSAGIEYKNGNFRTIKSTKKDLDVVAEGKAEVTISAGLELAVLTYNVAQLTVDAGIGGSLKATAHLVDEEFHHISSATASVSVVAASDLESQTQMTSSEDILMLAVEEGYTWNGYVEGQSVTLSTKVCLDWNIYPIVRLSARLFMPKTISASAEILGSKNAIVSGHIHFPNNIVSAFTSGSLPEGFCKALGMNETCSYEFTPWDVEETVESIADEVFEDATEPSLRITNGITVSTQRLFLDKGASARIEITGLPDGYTLDDLQAKSENASIATVNVALGRVYAGEESGTTTITIQTSDGKHHVTVAVTVYDDEPDDFIGLAGGKSV